MYKAAKSYKIPFEVVFGKCKKEAYDLGWDITYADKSKGHIVAETKMSLLSWGERIIIKVSKKGEWTEVQFTSEILSQIIDWGKNKSNFDSFIEKLEYKLGV